MRNQFSPFYRYSPEQIQAAWKDAVFVLDTNTLLNLYRYSKVTRSDLLGVLRALKDRIWIPFHVALEFQRNRLVVIAAHQKGFSELKKELAGVGQTMRTKIASLQLQKRHAVIDVEPILAQTDEFLKGIAVFLDDLKRQDDLGFDSDPIREQLDELLDGRVGMPLPEEQLKKIQEEGGRRFKHGMPPGFADEDKGKQPVASFMYQGLTYESKYGDLIVWRQIIEHAKSEGVKSLIFLTDDGKEDWWQTIQSNGPKRLGPRPELIEEIKREADVDFFYMYNSEKFLAHAKEYLVPGVQQEAIEEVADVLKDGADRAIRPSIKPFSLDSELGSCLRTWIVSRQLSIQPADRDGSAVIYGPKFSAQVSFFLSDDYGQLDGMLSRIIDEEVARRGHSNFLLVIVGLGSDSTEAARRWFTSMEVTRLNNGPSMIYGQIFQIPQAGDSTRYPTFMPMQGYGLAAAQVIHGPNT